MQLTVPVLVKVAVLMPITRPEESSKGPPELPALIAASVCRHLRTVSDKPTCELSSQAGYGTI